MKPAPLAYARAKDVAHALSLWQDAGPDARLIAGGQSLVAGLNLRLADIPGIIDISRIEALGGIEDVGDVLRIGALVTHAEIARSTLIAQCVPAMAQTAPLIAHAAIRTRGTIGGSLAYADPAAEWPACILALGGKIVVCSPAGERKIPAEAFFTGLFETALKPFEMIAAIEVPKAKGGDRHVVKELARRSGDYAMVGLVALLSLDERKIIAARLACFGVGDTPVLAQGAMAALVSGRDFETADIERAAMALEQDLDPPDDLQASGAMKKHLAKVLLRRCLAQALNT